MSTATTPASAAAAAVSSRPDFAVRDGRGDGDGVERPLRHGDVADITGPRRARGGGRRRASRQVLLADALGEERQEVGHDQARQEGPLVVRRAADVADRGDLAARRCRRGLAGGVRGDRPALEKRGCLAGDRAGRAPRLRPRRGLRRSGRPGRGAGWPS